VAILYLLNLICGLSVFFILKYFTSIKSFLDYAIYFTLIFTAQVVLTELILGLFGALTLAGVLAFNFLILLLVFYLPRLMGKAPVTFARGLFLKLRSNLSLGRLEYFCLSVLIGFGLVKLFINLINPPFGWDNLNYHFTFPVEWLKSGTLDTPIVVSDDPAPSFYPINASLIFLWFMLPLRNVFMADLASFPFYLLSGLIVYKMCRHFSLDRRSSLFSAVLFLLIPNIFKQLEIAYIDIIVCALYLASFYFVLKLRDEFKYSYAVMAGVSLGLLVGVKSLALVYSLTLFLPLFLILIRNKGFRPLGALLIVLSVVLLLGGYSYIKNFIITGNPLYPIDVTVLGKTLFKGVIDKASYSAHFVEGDYSLGKILYHEGLGAQSTLFVIPGVLLGLPLLFFRKRQKALPGDYYFALIPLIIFAIWRFVIPLANVRYLSPLLAVAMVYGFIIFDRLIPRKIIAVLVFACVMASISEFSKHAELAVSLALSGTAFILLLKGYIRAANLKLFSIILFSALVFFNHDYRQNEFKRYNNTPFWRDAYLSWQWLEENTQGNNISYVGRPVPFPLYGKDFKNKVYYTSVNGTDPAKLYYFNGSRYTWGYDFLGCHKDYEKENNYRGKADYKTWFSNLRRRKTDFLYVYSLHQIEKIEFPVEDSWAKTHPDVFAPIFTNDSVHIYRLI